MDPALVVVGLVGLVAWLRSRATSAGSSSTAAPSEGPPSSSPTLPFFDTGQPGRGGAIPLPSGATPGNMAPPGPSQPASSTPGMVTVTTRDKWVLSVDPFHTFERVSGSSFVRTSAQDLQSWLDKGAHIRDTSSGRWLFHPNPRLRLGAPPGTVLYDTGGLTPSDAP